MSVKLNDLNPTHGGRHAANDRQSDAVIAANSKWNFAGGSPSPYVLFYA
nr:hypothetical protein [Bradyrhizobium japonicum]